MKYGVSLDWLALYVRFNRGEFVPLALPTGNLAGLWDWGYKQSPHGTKQFSKLHHVYFEGEPFAEVQSAPHSEILQINTGIVKFDNRLLYQSNLWDCVQCFLEQHEIEILSISRVDICADFNAFACYDCRQFVEDFLNNKIRHKGRGIGAAYFNHYAKRCGVYSQSVVKYTGLTFGSRESGVRVYLYNKTFELNTNKNKPYIRDFWNNIGLDTTKDVWRLEVSITAAGRKFKDKATGEKKEIYENDLKNSPELVKLYHTFEKKYFAFVRNRPNITNITREPVLQLFDDYPVYKHGTISDKSCSNRTERILIKQLWQMSQKYRGYDMHSDEGLTKSLAQSLASACDLDSWLRHKQNSWEKPDKK